MKQIYRFCKECGVRIKNSRNDDMCTDCHRLYVPRNLY